MKSQSAPFCSAVFLEIKEGDECRTTGRVMDIPAGFDMLGRVVNPLGQPIDGSLASTLAIVALLSLQGPGIMQRQPVCEPKFRLDFWQLTLWFPMAAVSARARSLARCYRN